MKRPRRAGWRSSLAWKNVASVKTVTLSPSNTSARDDAVLGGRRDGVVMRWEPSPGGTAAAYSELESVLYGLANSGLEKIINSAAKNISMWMKRGGLNSQKLSNSWKTVSLGPGVIRKFESKGGERTASVAGNTKFGWGLTNTDKRAYAPIVTKAGVLDLLEILEYGTRPHRIAPRRAKRLLFYWENSNPELPVEGTNLFLGFFGQYVAHPGTRAYGFTRFTVAEAAVDMIKLLTALKNTAFYVGK